MNLFRGLGTSEADLLEVRESLIPFFPNNKEVAVSVVGSLLLPRWSWVLLGCLS